MTKSPYTLGLNKMVGASDEATDTIEQPTTGAALLAKEYIPGKSDYDAFVSYRRRDASQLARWIRDKLQGFRIPSEIIRALPPEKQELHERRPRIWLDTSYEKSNDDFLLKKVFPALDKSARLIVISTPSAFENIRTSDGQVLDNWLVREIDHFLGDVRADSADRPVDLVFGPGALEGRYPGRLSERARWDWIDLRGFNRWRSSAFSEVLDNGLTKLVAALYEVPDRYLPVLRREERRRRQQVIMGFAIAGFCIAAITGALAVWGFTERSNALTALQDSLTTRARMSVRLATEELNKRDPDQALAAALAGVETPSMDEPDRALIDESITAISSSISELTFDATMRGHSDAVLRAFFGPDGTSVITIGADNKVIAWSRGPEYPIRSVGETTLAGGVFAAVPDGRLIAAGSVTGEITFWSGPGSNLSPKPIDFGEPPVMLSLSDDGKHAAGVGSRGTLAVWNIPRNEPVWSESIPQARSSLVAFGRTCSCLVVGGTDGDLQIWPLDGKGPPKLVHGASGRITKGVFGGAGKLLFSTDDGRLWLTSEHQWPAPVSIGRHEGSVTDIAVSFDGNLAATAGVDGAVHIWDLRTGSEGTKIPTEPDKAITSVAFAPNGDSIALAFADGTIALWDFSRPASRPFETLVLRGHTAAVLDLSFSASGNRLASASLDGTARLWLVQTASVSQSRQAHDGPAIHALANGGRWALTAGTEDNIVRLWSGPPWKLTQSVSVHDPPSRLAISVDGRRAFIGTQNGDILQWETKGTRVDPPISRDNGALTSLAISPDQAVLTAIGIAGKLQVCEIAETTSPCAPVAEHLRPGYSVDISEDGHWIGASAGYEQGVGKGLVWNTRAKTALSLPGLEDRVLSIQFDRRGERAVTASLDGRVRIWESATGRELVRIEEPKGRLSTAGFSADGEWIATCSYNRTVRLWRVPRSVPASKPFVLSAHDSQLVSDEFAIGQIQFDPTGHLLAASLASGDIKLWHMPDRIPRGLLKGDGSEILIFSFQPDGSHVTATTARGRLLEWSVSPALVVADEVLLPLARATVPVSGSLAGKLEQPVNALSEASQACSYDGEHYLGLPPHGRSGAARAREQVVIPASCQSGLTGNAEPLKGGLIAEAEGDFATAAKRFRAAAATDPAALIGLGDLDLVHGYRGDGATGALSEYTRARDLGAPYAYSRLGWLFLTNGQKDVEQAMASFARAAQEGDADGFAGLAWLKDQYGNSVEDLEVAFSNYVSAQYAYERDRDFLHAQQVAERRSMVARLLPPERISSLFLTARRSIQLTKSLQQP